MEKNEIPQDKSGLEGYTKELYYAKGKDGSYDTGLSKGWETKSAALDNAWGAIHDRIEEVRQQVANGEKSPVLYFMEKQLMDPNILASYMGMMTFRVKRHFKPSVFKKLSDKKLKKYADVFKISVEELKSFKG